MALQVKFAVYGALPGGNPEDANAFDVTQGLQTLMAENAGVVTCDISSFGDPSVGNEKHFAAVVDRNGTNFCFACQEGQTIDFNHGGGVLSSSGEYQVSYAVYGALPGGSESQAQAADVRAVLQSKLDHAGPVVVISNDSLGIDPAVGNEKHFAALVVRAGVVHSFACQEGQTIDFSSGGGN
jgi:hypothetical protein